MGSILDTVVTLSGTIRGLFDELDRNVFYEVDCNLPLDGIEL